MGDRFANFRALSEQFQDRIDYRIRMAEIGSSVLILAPHGGGIERGTSELASAIAGDDLSLYLFEGLLPTARQSQDLHITSTRFDEPKCLGMISHYKTIIAFHGCCGHEPIIHLGGSDTGLQQKLFKHLLERNYPVRLGRGKYAGKDPNNICNKSLSGHGVQVELSNGMRRKLFDHFQTRKGHRTITELFIRLTSDIRETIA